MDLLALLPPGPVRPGDSWPVEFEGFRDVLRPAGQLECRSEPPESEGERELAQRLWASLSGEIVARYDGPGPRDALDGPSALVTFRGATRGSGELHRGAVGVTDSRLTSEHAVEGRLVWDLARHRARSLSLTSRGRVVAVDDVRVREEGVERAFERELRFREESRLEAHFDDLSTR